MATTKKENASTGAAKKTTAAKKTAAKKEAPEFNFHHECKDCGINYSTNEMQENCFNCGSHFNSQKPKNIAQAILQVMSEVKGIDKSLVVGEGKFSYKGVSDKDVKLVIGEAMKRAGLCILPIDIFPDVKIERWTETTNYGDKQKQQVFTEVKTKYLLMHESGETREIVGYGHGVDTQDKSAGKSTTYALKMTLLYLFLVPTGHIDDTDKQQSKGGSTTQKPTLTDEQLQRALDKIDAGNYTKEELLNNFTLTKEQIIKIK